MSVYTSSMPKLHTIQLPKHLFSKDLLFKASADNIRIGFRDNPDYRTEKAVTKHKEQLARDLHDGIGSQLTHIISKLELLAYKNKDVEGQLHNLRDFASETMIQLRETIWILNQKEITFDQLSQRIKGLLSRISADLETTTIEVKSIGEADQCLPSELTMSIFRIIQEAVNNAIKYACSSKITVFIALEESGVWLQIDDDGCGFKPDQIKPGFGLINIQSRVNDHQGDLNIASSGGGTKIAISLPIGQ